jgi:uncharacterized coiled-coil protein SlyX
LQQRKVGQLPLTSSRGHSGGDDDGRRSAADAAERLAALETEAAFQGDTLRELSDAFAAQQLDILTLQRQVCLLSEQLTALRADISCAEQDGSDDEPPPPHY